MWLLIPLLVLGAVALAASRSPRALAPPPLALPAPGPIAVLGEFARQGHVPPPPVILCALAEAEAIGRDDIASDIVRLFIAPVVYAHFNSSPQAHFSSSPQAHFSSSPQAHFAPPQAHCIPPQFAAPPRGHYERGTCAVLPGAPRAAVETSCALPVPSAPPLAAPAPTKVLTDEEIRAMLNADPAGFFAMVTRGGPVIDVPSEPVQPPQPQSPPQQPTVEQMQEAAEAVVSSIGSPIDAVPDDAWREFARRLEREPTTFSSSRHVGQYRQRRERLAELGIDPAQVLGSALAQRGALDVDLADAHHHAAEGGLLAEHLGRPVVVPGHDASNCITLSGLLGVIQCAGFDGAVGWLERPGDRMRYPHTSQAFTRTNGLF